jgi:hypothetical protein
MEAVKQTYSYNDLVDCIEFEMYKNGLFDVSMTDLFTPGMYSRTIIVPPNVYLTSLVHKTEHQYLVSKGAIVIYTEDNGMVLIQSPYLGITLPGVRRFAKTVTDVVWTTFHPTNIQPKSNSEEDINSARELVEKEIFEKYENLLLVKESEEIKLCLE